MRTIYKDCLDEIIRLTRKYTKTGDVDVLSLKHRFDNQASMSAFGTNSKWLAIDDIVSAILGPGGINKSAPNSMIYDIFKVVGIEIKESENGGSSDE